MDSQSGIGSYNINVNELGWNCSDQLAVLIVC